MSFKGKSKSQSSAKLEEATVTGGGNSMNRIRHPSIDAVQIQSTHESSQSTPSNHHQFDPTLIGTAYHSNSAMSKPGDRQVYSSSSSSSSSLHSLIHPHPHPTHHNHNHNHNHKSTHGQIYHRHQSFPQFVSDSFRDLQSLTSLVDNRSNWYESSRLSPSQIDSLTSRESRKLNKRSKKVANELKNYYQRMNLILDGWREADEIVDSQFPAEVLKRFGNVDQIEIARIEREGIKRKKKVRNLERKIKTNAKSKGNGEREGQGQGQGQGERGTEMREEIDGNVSDDEGGSQDDDEEEEGDLLIGNSPNGDRNHVDPFQEDDDDEDAEDDDGLIFGTKGKSKDQNTRRNSFAKTISGWFSPSSKGKPAFESPLGRERVRKLDLEQGLRRERDQVQEVGRDSKLNAQGARVSRLNYGSIQSQSRTNGLGNDPKNQDQEESQPLLNDGTPENSREEGTASFQTNSREDSKHRKKSKSAERKTLTNAIPGAEKQAEAEREAQFAININLLINILLLLGKGFAVLSSNSVSLIASLVDSALDLLSTVIIFFTSKAISYRSHATMYKYPVGKRRLEPLGVVVFAVLMIASFFQVLVESISRFRSSLKNSPGGENGISDLPLVGIVFMLATIAIKALMWFLYRKSPSSGVRAVAQDAENDVVFNIASLIFPLVGSKLGWAWLDPLGGIVLSVYIIYEWLETLFETITKLSGSVGDPESISKCLYLITRFNQVKSVSALELYHSGDDTIVEADVVLPHSIQLKDAHDVGEIVQYCTESLQTVERAYIHLDYNPLGQKGHLATRG